MSDYSIKVVIQAVDKFSAGMKKVESSLTKFGASAAKIGAGLSIGVTAPIAALGMASIRTFQQFETGMANVSTLVDTTKESMSGMSDQLLAMSTRVPVALDDLTGSLYDIRSAGISASDAMSVLEGSARLATAGLGTSKEATDIVTSSINAFNLKGAEQARLYDVIFKTVKNGKTTISSLAQGFGAVAGTVSNAGVKIDEYMASVAALTTTGLPAAQAHTQLRAAIAGVTRQSELGDAVLHKLGAKTFKELVSKSGGMVQAFDKISKTLGGNDAALIQLFGSVEAYNAVVGLTGKQNGVFVSTLDDMRNGADAVGAAFDKQSKTFANRMQLTKSSILRSAVIIGEALAPAIVKVANLIKRLADWFSTLSQKTQKIVLVVVALTAGLGPLLIGFGFLVVVLASLTVPIALAVAGIVALSAAIAAAVIYLDDIKAAASSAFSTIVDWAGRAYDAVKPILDAIAFVAKWSPAGMVIRGGMAVAGALTGGAGDPATPGIATRGAARGGPAAASNRKQELSVKITNENAPKGQRTQVDSASPGIKADTYTGYNLAGIN